jgi:DNA-binding transcriptional MerR regulator
MERCYNCQVDAENAATLTIDELAGVTGTTTRRIRSLQTLGLLPHPMLRGRTGLYGEAHRHRLETVLALQEQGFSLESLVVLFDALATGQTLAGLLGTAAPPSASGGAADTGTDTAELYGFAELQHAGAAPRQGRSLLSVVPTTVWDESQAS